MRILFCFSVLFLSGCVSETEQKTISRVQEIYGGTCVKSIKLDPLGISGVETATLNFSIRDSEILIKHFDSLRLPASNIALIAFTELDSSELQKYNKILIEVHRDAENSKVIEYSMKELNEVKDLKSTFERIVNLIQLGDSVGIVNEFREDDPISSSNFIRFCNSAKELCGRISNVSISGFEVNADREAENSRIRVQAVLVGDKGSTTLFIEFFRKSKKVNSMMVGFDLYKGLYL